MQRWPKPIPSRRAARTSGRAPWFSTAARLSGATSLSPRTVPSEAMSVTRAARLPGRLADALGGVGPRPEIFFELGVKALELFDELAAAAPPFRRVQHA